MQLRTTWQTITEVGVVAILRKLPTDSIDRVADALIAGGIRAIEITVDSPGAMGIISRLAERVGHEVAIGAGTVLDAPTAREAIAAGADFLLAPCLNIDMIETCHRYGKLAVPGVFTPTEIVTALNAGAQLIKLFPSGPLGASYVKDVLGPLPQASLLPTGGITLDNAASFIQAGAVAIGLGGSLVNANTVARQDMDAITKSAHAFVDAVATARRSRP